MRQSIPTFHDAAKAGHEALSLPGGIKSTRTPGWLRLCCTNRLMAVVSLTRTDSSHGFRDGYAERGEAVQHGDTDLELCDLTVEVPGGQPLAK